MISNTQHMLLSAAVDSPVTEFADDLVPVLESLRKAGLIQWTVSGYKITAKGKAALRWDAKPSAL